MIGTLAVDGWAVTFGTARRGLGRDVKVSRPCWSRDRKLWSRSRSHEDVGLGLTHVGLVVSK